MFFAPIYFVFGVAIAIFLDYRKFLGSRQPAEAERIRASHGAAFAVLTSVFWQHYGLDGLRERFNQPDVLAGAALVAFGVGWLIYGSSPVVFIKTTW